MGLRIAVRHPDLDAPLDGIALMLLPLAGSTAADESQTAALMRRCHALEQPAVVEGISTASQWERLRKSGLRYGSGVGLQAALTPLEFSVWAGARETKTL